MKIEENIKPCLCGETEPNVHLQLVYIIEDDKEKYCVMCESCDQETDNFNTPEEAIKVWNSYCKWCKSDNIRVEKRQQHIEYDYETGAEKQKYWTWDVVPYKFCPECGKKL